MPHASTLTRTQPGCGSGMSRSTISNGPPARGTWTTRIFLLMSFHRSSLEKHKNYSALVRQTFAADDSNPRDTRRPNDSTAMKARRPSHPIFHVIFFAAVFVIVFVNAAAAEKGALLTGKAAMSDWTGDAPRV